MRTLFIAFVILMMWSGPARAEWISSWSASPQPLWAGDFTLDTRVPFHLWQQTLRQSARLSQGGERLQVEVSNRYGTQTLMIGAASVSLSAGEDVTELRFSDQTWVEIPPGASVLSDPVSLPVPDLATVWVDLYLPEPSAASTMHWDGLQDAFILPGNATGQKAKPLATLSSRLYLTQILVDTPHPQGLVVAFGDSITDGNASTFNGHQRWPDQLASRLASDGVAVTNAGISGARLLLDKMGVNALARFEQDVLSQPGVSQVVILMGINDIGWPGSAHAPDLPEVRTQDLIFALKQLITRAHAHGVEVILGTLPPFAGALDMTPIEDYYTPEKDAVRMDLNTWIRNASGADAVVDFDAALQDPNDPLRMNPTYDSGDHLHPSDAGYQRMADEVYRVLQR